MKILKFYTDWCGPCKHQTQLLKDCPIEVQHINVDTEESDALVEKFNIRNVPTLIIVNDKEEELKRFLGITPLSKITDFIEKYNSNETN